MKAGRADLQKANPTARQLLTAVIDGVFPMVPPPSRHADRAIAIVDRGIALAGPGDPKVSLIWGSFKGMYNAQKFGRKVIGA